MPYFQPPHSMDANDSTLPLAFGVMNSKNYEDWLWFLTNLKKLVQDKEVVIIFDKHPTLIGNVLEVFGVEKRAYCYHHMKENFNHFLSKYNTRGHKDKENVLQFINSISYARLKHDYNVCMFELWKYNDALATWVEENAPKHWTMSKLPKQRWDKMITNLDKSFNAWLRSERHHSTCNFLVEYMVKLSSILVKHKEAFNNWKRSIGSKIEKKVLQNISKGKVYLVTPFMNDIFGVCIGRAFLSVDIMNYTYTCRGCQILGTLMNMWQPLYFRLDKMLLILLMIDTNAQGKS